MYIFTKWTEHLCLALVLLEKNNTGLFTEYSVLIYATLMIDNINRKSELSSLMTEQVNQLKKDMNSIEFSHHDMNKLQQEMAAKQKVGEV
ncbi:hypothetical protein K6959_01560 [Bacillus aquiflavi]|uniref:hypothetical protein n=1 Tax=Bacillus aquiflavi TaxID=2672567 RepID=UPI001CA8ECC8|nr:hypothetical protein [Bacillus aquiflavi]UAC48696.1 hypothetical protein K6959_01560 [Bacillus aquiflavi]